jgi:D-mannonate dehydratase
MYLGTQIQPRGDSDYKMWVQLGVRHICAGPPGNPHDWSVDDLNRYREHLESFGLILDLVTLPVNLASGRGAAEPQHYARARAGPAARSARYA